MYKQLNIKTRCLGNGLVPPDNKPLSDAMFIQIYGVAGPPRVTVKPLI